MVQMYRMHEVPSLNGKTKVKAFVPIRVPGPTMAFDEAPRKRSFSGSLRSLARDMSAEEWGELHKLLGGSEAEDEEEPHDLEHLKIGLAKAKDEPGPNPDPSARWVEKGHAEQAADAAPRGTSESFFRMFPEAASVRPDP